MTALCAKANIYIEVGLHFVDSRKWFSDLAALTEAGEGDGLGWASSFITNLRRCRNSGYWHSISLRRGVSEEVTAQVKVQLERKEAFSIRDVSGSGGNTSCWFHCLLSWVH